MKKMKFTRITNVFKCLLFWISFFCFSPVLLFSQFNDYTETWPLFLTDQTSYSGNGVSVFDFNQDGFDDLTIPEHNTGIALFAFNGDGFTLVDYIPHQADIKQIIWVDADNDDDYDLFYTTNDDGIHLYENLGSLQLTEVPNAFDTSSETFAYGASFGDYDRDGLLDVFVGAYNYFGETYMPNMLFKNMGNLNFTNVADQLGVGVSTGVAFQPVWCDFNADFWPDIYLINDHSIENELYINNHGEGFENVAQTTQSNVAMNSMTNSIADYDQDGDFDILITDSYYQVLLNNEGMQFSDVAEEAGVRSLSNDWAGLWIDVNLDGYEDLQICTQNFFQNNRFYLNNGDGTFDLYFNEPEGFESYASAAGDFDNDLKPDYIVTHGNPFGYHLYQNKSVGTHALKCLLKGVYSNRDGIGARIEFFFDDHQFNLEHRAGENYIGQNSQYKLLGCADNTQLDSLKIYWPSGIVDAYYNLPSNAFYEFVEGITYDLLEESFIQYEICHHDSLLLEAPEFPFWYWSDGVSDVSRYVSESGVYQVLFSDNNIIFDTLNFSVIIAEQPVAQISEPTCFESNNGSVIYNSVNDQNLSATWSDGFIGMERYNLAPGEYFIELAFMPNCSISDTVFIPEVNPIIVTFVSDTICVGYTASVEYQIDGGAPPFQIEWNGLNPLAVPPGNHEVVIQDSLLCEEDVVFTVTAYEQITIEIADSTVCYGDSILVSDFFLAETGSADWWIENADGAYLSAGSYTALWIDQNGCNNSEHFSILENDALIVEGVVTHPVTQASGGIALSVAGGQAPYTFLWSNGSVEDFIDYLDAGPYSCTITDQIGCGNSVEFLLSGITAKDEFNAPLKITSSEFGNLWNLSGGGRGLIHVYDASGKKISTQRKEVESIFFDSSSWASGLYLVVLGGDCIKFIKN